MPTTTAPTPGGSNADAAAIVKSPNDKRDYRYLRLANQMQVLLVSDPATDKAAASLVVQRGSFHEPEDRPGIAHFLEHMLFIGTEKYPAVDAYQQYIGTHGGSSNAYTALDHTNYFFDINPPQFRQATDRFAQFFISPLFAEEYVEREKNAVYSEYQLQSKDDSWRANAAQKQALNQAHPGSRFTIGSLDTLNGEIRQDLLKFFAENYSADQMILVALAPESLTEMQDWIVPLFEQVPNRQIGPATKLPPMYLAEQLPATLRVETVKENYRLAFEFAVPSDRAYYRAKPLLYITNLLGHEGDGSLHQALKSRGWIESLASASGEFDENTSLVSVDIELTAAGRDKIPEISKALFDQIKLLRESPPSQRLQREQAQMLELAFRFQEPTSPTSFVYRTAPALMNTPPAEILRAPFLMTEFKPELIQQYLGYLTPDNVFRTISGPEVETSLTEPWFQVPYALEREPIPLASDFNPALELPAANEFLPEQVELVDSAASQPPVLAVRQPGVALWVAADTEFGTPRSNTFLTLAVPGGLQSPSAIAHGQLYARLVADSLNEYAYPAFLAGLGYRITVSARGFEVGLSGYDDKQPLLLDKVLDAFSTLRIDPARLALYRDELAEDWRSFSSERPYTQSIAALSNLLVSDSWPPAALAAAVTEIDANSLTSWAAQMRQRLSVVGLLHGNVQPERPRAIAQALATHLNLSDFAITDQQVYDNLEATRFGLDVDHQDAAMVLYLQGHDSSYETQAGIALAAQLMRQSYFTQLRTEDQLGYVVGLSYRPYRDRPGIAFIVQSPVADPKALEARTYRFLEQQISAVEQLTPTQFADFKTGLISDLTERPKNLNERSGRFWGDLRLDKTDFDSRKQLAAAVATIEQEQAVGIIRELRERLPQQQLLIYSTGKFEQAPERGTRIHSVDSLKAG